MRNFPHLRSAVLVSSILGALASLPAFANEKITLCHLPPGEPENARAILVSENAVDAHLEHGDELGDCTVQGGFCGDGIVQDGEGCDFPDLAGGTCVDVLGEGATGQPGCTGACELSQGSCELCGNGVREGSEECDGEDDAACPVGPGFTGCDSSVCLCDEDGLD